MRVALVCPYSWTSPGGVQSHVRGLARALRAAGVGADVLAPADGPVEPGVVPLGTTIPIRDNGSVVRVALAPAAGRRTRRLIAAGGYDVVHLHEPMIPLACLWPLLRARTALVGTFHRYAETPGWYRTFEPLCRAALARLDLRVAVSEAARRHVAARCPGDYEVVPNGIDAGPEPAPRRRGGAGAIVFVGRPEPRKGLPVLLAAFARLPGAPRLDLVGVTAREARRLGEGLPGMPWERVRAHGRVSDARRDALLREADALCSPALRGESFGIVLAEAMAAGIPVVATQVGGQAELAAPPAGRLVAPGDPDAIAAALAELLDDGEGWRRAASAARERARALDWSAVSARLLALYERALARRAARSAHPRPAGDDRVGGHRSAPAGVDLDVEVGGGAGGVAAVADVAENGAAGDPGPLAGDGA